MQQPNRWLFFVGAVVLRLIVGRGQTLLQSMLAARRAFLFSTFLLMPFMTLPAEESKVHLLEAKSAGKSLTTEMVREIFFMRLNSWPDGSPIHVFVLPDNHPLHVRFAKEILGVYPFQLRSAWDRLVFSGTGVSPTTVESLEEMRARVDATPGSIGYTDQK